MWGVSFSRYCLLLNDDLVSFYFLFQFFSSSSKSKKRRAKKKRVNSATGGVGKKIGISRCRFHEREIKKERESSDNESKLEGPNNSNVFPFFFIFLQANEDKKKKPNRYFFQLNLHISRY